MINALALSTSYPKEMGNGTAPFIREISHALVAQGVAVHLLLPDHPDLQWPDGDSPVHLYRHRYLPSFVSDNWYVWGYGGALIADRRLRGRAVGVLPSAALSAAYRLIGMTRKVKPDVLHAHWLLPAGPIVGLVSRICKIPYVVSLHGSGVFLAEQHPIFEAVGRFALRGATHISACSGDLAERALKMGAYPGSLSVVPYGVDIERFRPDRETARRQARRDLGVESGRMLVLAVGRLVAKKGFGHLIDAMAAVNEAELVIAGSGDLEGDLRRKRSALGIESRVRMLGNVSQEQVQGLYAAADVLVVPSIRDELGNVDGLPNVILEGMASGLPIIASRIAGIPQAIRHEKNGLLVEPGDVASLSSALARLTNDADLCRLLGRQARADAVSGFQWSDAAESYSRMLRTACLEFPCA